MNEQSIKSNKLVSDIEMHYNIILGFTQGSQSTIGHPMESVGSIKDIITNKEITQHTTMAMPKQLHLHGECCMDQDDAHGRSPQ